MSDAAAPTLTSLNLSTSSTGAGQHVTFALGASDDLSGVQSGIVWLDHSLMTVDQSGNTSRQDGINIGSPADPLSDGLSSTTVSVSPFSAGTYNVSVTL